MKHVFKSNIDYYQRWQDARYRNYLIVSLYTLDTAILFSELAWYDVYKISQVGRLGCTTTYPGATLPRRSTCAASTANTPTWTSARWTTSFRRRAKMRTILDTVMILRRRWRRYQSFLAPLGRSRWPASRPPLPPAFMVSQTARSVFLCNSSYHTEPSLW